jgi:hypothetical protein
MELCTHLVRFGSLFPLLPQQPFFPFSPYDKSSNFQKNIGHENLSSTTKQKRSKKKKLNTKPKTVTNIGSIDKHA